MRFYTKKHGHYCGIDLHAKTMYLCILDKDGRIVLHKNMKSQPEAFLAAVEPFREDLVVAVESANAEVSGRRQGTSLPIDNRSSDRCWAASTPAPGPEHSAAPIICADNRVSEHNEDNGEAQKQRCVIEAESRRQRYT